MKNYKGMPSLEGHKVIIKVMKEHGISRLIDWGTPSISFKSDKTSFITVIPKLLAGIFHRQGKKELIAISKLIVDSGLDWTLVRFLAPKDTPYTGMVKVSFGDITMDMKISRSDIAGFMVRQLTSKQYLH